MPRAYTSPSSSYALGSVTSSSDYGLLETLDRDHFYGSVEEALTDIGPTLGEEKPAP